MNSSKVRLGEVCKLHYGKSLREYQNLASDDNCVRVFGTNGPIGWTKEALTDHSTLVIGRKGAYRGVHFSETPSWTIDTAFFTTIDEGRLNLKWFYYRLCLLDINRMNSGGAIPSTSREDFYSVEINAPGLLTQARVASVLSTYDDLIENNRRRIELLEEAARMLFREWFVHFRFPGYEHVEIINGIPEGWEVCRLDDCVSFRSGGTPSKAKEEYWQGDVPWISSGELTTMRVCTSQYSVTNDAVAAGSRYAERDTILAVVRGMSLAKEFRVGIVSKRVCFNQDIKALEPDRGVEGLFLFHALFDQKEDIRQRATEASHGTKKLETSVLEGLKIVVPLAAVRRQFIDYVEPMHAQWDVLFQQNRHLIEARDLLLPRVMNGEIAV
ncbi:MULTISPECIES: restriction endonuclease subunit S [Mesorhizobium]|uniref:restriction endonuclease subunit S n=1 Tax=Mesorhizobium TaxID=68287 RepID=UPI0010A961AD|nr:MULTISPECIES: restriction endonuclease subunit S [Mesorhizobium]